MNFSIGALTYRNGQITAAELVGRADDLMYSIKRVAKTQLRSQFTKANPCLHPELHRSSSRRGCNWALRCIEN